MGALRSGYRRRPTTSASERGPAKGPYFDEIDERWAPEIRTAYEKIAGTDPPWQGAKYLSEKGVPKTSNAILTEWTEENVKSLIRETIYRGHDVYRDRHSTPVFETGRKKPERSDASQKLTREMPHLRIVSDELWWQANAAIDARRPPRNCPSGSDNPLYGVPRDSRSLLSTLFKCGICGAPMHKGGRGGRAYTCSAAQNRKCWNRATAEYGLIENAVKQVVRDQLSSVDPVVDDFLNRLDALIGDRDALRQRMNSLVEKKNRLNVAIRRLIKVLENKKNPSETVLERIEALEGKLRRTSGKLGKLERLLSGSMIPSREDVLRRVQTVAADLNADQKTAGVALRKIIQRIEAVPFQQFNSGVVVLRGRIVVHIARLLSVELASVLAGLHGEGIETEFASTTVTVDLFRPSTGPAFGLKAEALEREQRLGLMQIAKRLDLNKRRAHLALQYGRAMRQAGLVDPFVELTSPPAKAAHWGPHQKPRRPPKKSTRPADPAGPAAAP
jgi:regulator of replication initiation timing